MLAAIVRAWPQPGVAQQPSDSLKVYTLPPAVVSVTRSNPPINRIPIIKFHF